MAARISWLEALRQTSSSNRIRLADLWAQLATIVEPSTVKPSASASVADHSCGALDVDDGENDAWRVCRSLLDWATDQLQSLDIVRLPPDDTTELDLCLTALKGRQQTLSDHTPTTPTNGNAIHRLLLAVLYSHLFLFNPACPLPLSADACRQCVLLVLPCAEIIVPTAMGQALILLLLGDLTSPTLAEDRHRMAMDNWLLLAETIVNAKLGASAMLCCAVLDGQRHWFRQALFWRPDGDRFRKQCYRLLLSLLTQWTGLGTDWDPVRVHVLTDLWATLTLVTRDVVLYPHFLTRLLDPMETMLRSSHHLGPAEAMAAFLVTLCIHRQRPIHLASRLPKPIQRVWRQLVLAGTRDWPVEILEIIHAHYLCLLRSDHERLPCIQSCLQS